MSNKISSFNILDSIGNTPLVRLQKIVPKSAAAIYVKLEYMNPTGAYKDRMALAIIEGAERRGELKKGMTVVENTAGGTGTALALVCAIKGYRFIAVTSDAFAKEKLQAMELFGAELDMIASDGGRITPELVPRMMERAKEITEGGNVYWTRQFYNRDALEGYGKLANEILDQLDHPIDAFCAAVGTAGMVTGTSTILKYANPKTHIVILEPASAPFLSSGKKGTHKVDGIAPGFKPPLLNEALYDEVRTVDESDARKMAKRLAAEEGIFAGTSTGLNVCAALKLAEEQGPDHTVVTVACDSGMKYMSAGLFD